ncbi:MAG: MBL fold metallo-hydrolase [Deltaproteobacteria bacterium]|nr:MAG: MBL fold metallo-hydrolase [Deltaproteobacteria bacterium]
MTAHLSKFLAALTAVLALWVVVLITPARDFLALTGMLNLPVPAHAAVAPVPDQGYRLEAVGDGVYFLNGWSHNTLFVVTDEGVVAVDAPPSIGGAYLDAIREVTDKPVTHVIYSHSHGDHIDSANQFAGATFIAHAETAAVLAAKHDPSRPLPTVTFEDHYTLELGGKVIELAYHGPAHSPGNIAIYLPQDKVLAAIDIAFPKWVPIHEFAIAEDIDAYYAMYDELLAYDFDAYIGGHLDLGTRADVVDQRDYARDIRTAAREAFASLDVTQLGKRAAGSPNTWVTVNFGLNRMAGLCEDQVVDAWGGKLAGTDVFTHSHCKRMVFHAMTE